MGEAEEARALGEDTLQPCHRVLGPDHPITEYLTQAISNGQLMQRSDTECHKAGGLPRITLVVREPTGVAEGGPVLMLHVGLDLRRSRLVCMSWTRGARRFW